MAALPILVVEDVEEMREMLKALFEGIEEIGAIATAANLWEARMELGRRRPGLVFLDEVLPGESSLEFVAELKEEGIPVLLMTGVLSRAEPLPLGALERLFKPEWRKMDADRARFREAFLRALGRK